jgi:hypothetical protein
LYQSIEKEEVEFKKKKILKARKNLNIYRVVMDIVHK